MKQIGLGLQGHLDAKKYFPLVSTGNVESAYGPAGTAPKSFSWIVKILPFMEETTIYDRLGQTSNRFKLNAILSPLHTTIDVPDTEHIASTVIATLICPTYPGNTRADPTVAIRYALTSNLSIPAALTNYNAMVATHLYDTGVLPDKTGDAPADGTGFAGNGGMAFAAPGENS